MNDSNRFDPFNNRLCRNVRNALSEGFTSAIETGEMQPVQRIAAFFTDDPQPAHVRGYIESRMASYENVLAAISDRRMERPLDIATIIWDHQLFFETHEYLETFWLKADGEEKKLLQAVIRAAGTYVHLEQGNLVGARRIADKALAGLKNQQRLLSSYVDVDLLLNKLKVLDPAPPMLSGTGAPG